MIKKALKNAVRPLWRRLKFRVGAERSGWKQLEQLTAELDHKLDQIRAFAQPSVVDLIAVRLDAVEASVKAIAERVGSGEADLESRLSSTINARVFVPVAPAVDPTAPFMGYSTCGASDMLHPRFADFCRQICHPPSYHRKLWEWAFIVHHLTQAGMLEHGRRGVGFGVGNERLPALFASRGCDIVATDAPPEIGLSSGWSTTGQHATSTDELRFPEIVDDATFDAKVAHRFCDMNAIDVALTDFDFCWSSCCFEHLGDLEAGIQFVINSVEKTLKPGGVAVHTTEYNLLSNNETLEKGPTVIYRHRDIEDLFRRLEERGHQVKPFVVAPNGHPLDFHVDVPPYQHNPHLKLKLWQYTTTSVGLVIIRDARSV